MSCRITTFTVSNPNCSKLWSKKTSIKAFCSFRSLRVSVSGYPRGIGNSLLHSSSNSRFRLAASLELHGMKNEILVATPPSDSVVVDELKNKEWEIGVLKDEIAAMQGIRIRRTPPTGPPAHYVGTFEFLQNEDNTPRNKLEEIVWTKYVEVKEMKEKNALSSLKKALDNAPPLRDFIGSLKESYLRTGSPGLIAEVKKASPSRGVLRENFHPVEVAKAYEKGGAACLSVLTDEKYFQGSFENLVAIRNAGVKCPLLCKEFIVDAWQLYYARTKGADAVLLIAAVLPDIDIKYMLKICRKIGLAALVEVHDENEMDRMLAIDGIELIGINNRNLETFEVDISNTKKLLEGERGEKLRQKNIIVVGESGLFTPADIAYVQEAGVKAILVGESIVKQEDPTKGIRDLFGKDISA
ncbi:indole-3-glycerol phosphate synthase, chloroplastic-like isoform X1 [Cynara cardunculus var. scolymus]|uniref:indole-3-glycerol-phosphate synthase n=1 Tax=Cynara cardunculus var. scolymus TaxID=59895 RepID=A0A103YK77_CYNCS|nr:indole-3-glycerol phosphate synthase, chloroplastic-like isoform X1 [Cynara cardunculus var. scolymus]XP_024965656.1 indole-3-glycerol phosphate synthase, chloroplastic-like isoform X1 [Cynara cardunculus var. scolymus]KVI10604.1 Aldolase-type TIM barrel [Cynara cardunculus var. scolymus]